MRILGLGSRIFYGVTYLELINKEKGCYDLIMDDEKETGLVLSFDLLQI